MFLSLEGPGGFRESDPIFETKLWKPAKKMAKAIEKVQLVIEDRMG